MLAIEHRVGRLVEQGGVVGAGLVAGVLEVLDVDAVGAVAPTTAGRTDAQVMTADVVRAAVDDGNLAGAIDIHAGGHRALVEHDAATEAGADGNRREPGDRTSVV